MILVKTINSIIWILLIPNSGFSSKMILDGQIHRDFLDPKIQESYFEQKLDHFNLSNGETWQQRYWINWRYYEEGGPAFLLINGQSQADINEIAVHSGIWSCDTSTENLIYLSIPQALNDIAYFISGVTKKYLVADDIEWKWIVFGCSYAGSLAAWVRLKYPFLVHGAVASSAPLLKKADYAEYYEVVKASLDKYNPKCSSKVAEANKQLDHLIKTEAGRKHATKLFQLCNELENTTDHIASLFDMLASNFATAVQYNLAYQKSEDDFSHKESIKNLCDIMTYPGASALNLYAAVHILKLTTNSWPCFYHDNKDKIVLLKKIDYDSNINGERQRYYQTCTEDGYSISFNKTSDTFGTSNLTEYQANLCQKVFGPKFTEARLKKNIDRINTMYGGLKINVGNLIFVHGSIDPWHAFGITRVEHENSPYNVIFINGTAHCADTRRFDGEIDDVKEARQKIVTIIRSWLQNE